MTYNPYNRDFLEVRKREMKAFTAASAPRSPHHRADNKLRGQRAGECYQVSLLPRRANVSKAIYHFRKVLMHMIEKFSDALLGMTGPAEC